MNFSVFFCSVTLIFIAYLEWNQPRKKTLRTIISILLPLLTSLLILSLIIEYSYAKSGDYLSYEGGARAIIDGVNPYIRRHRLYAYPPLLAQTIVFIQTTAPHFFLVKEPGDGWQIAFYLYQCSNFFMFLLAYGLCYVLARQIGIKQFLALLVVTGLFIFNNPIISTLRWHQVNLWILNTFLVAIVTLNRYPWVAGSSIALGIHIKLYPLILGLPWLITRKWRACLAVVFVFFVILMIQTNFGREWEQWHLFLDYFSQNVEKPTTFRNNSFNSLVRNLFFFANLPAGGYRLLLRLVQVVMGIWLVQRFSQREKYYRQLIDHMNVNRKNQWANIYRFYGHSMDAIALGLFISPSVWVHHFILAIPIAIWTLATQFRYQPWLVGIAIFLIYALPTFDIFLFSYHRLLGLILLIYLSNPAKIYNYFAEKPRETSIFSLV